LILRLLPESSEELSGELKGKLEESLEGRTALRVKPGTFPSEQEGVELKSKGFPCRGIEASGKTEGP